MYVVLLGPPGVGKGTQGVFLTQEPNWTRIVTGDLLRDSVASGSELGLEAEGYMTSGGLVPDALIVSLLRDHMVNHQVAGNMVFDGFPRTSGQACELTEMLDVLGKRIEILIVLEAEDRALVERISGRRSCPDCKAIYNVHTAPPTKEGICDQDGAELVHRTDDKPETVANRLEVYRSETEPVIQYYEGIGSKVCRINGDEPVGEVRINIAHALGLGKG
ncbi:MAG: adenylate kinase [Gemmatimonadetes bacterium]|nr:adenylate kinase [Gemmatimonadota bacterium]|tara:strand:+ start:644 stop:1300 length:657 start_codon:yes stop_codon:yes gene_type:complete